MPYIKIWIHLIWSTKNRYPFLKKPIRAKIISHIKENAKDKKIHLDFINGFDEHIHTLISLKADQTIAKVAHLLKGESSHWVNEQQLTKTKFGWQDEYMAVSISHSAINKVREYIKNQEEHHRKKTFAEEYQLFLDKYGFEILGKTRGLKPQFVGLDFIYPRDKSRGNTKIQKKKIFKLKGAKAR